MVALKSFMARDGDLADSFVCVSQDDPTLRADRELVLWRQWLATGTMRMGRVDCMERTGIERLMVVGVTVWITDEAVAALAQPSNEPAHRRLYDACWRGEHWVMNAAEIASAHERQALNLMVLHFWALLSESDPRFNVLFLHAQALFRDQHQGFGLACLYQQALPHQAPFLEAAGFSRVGASPNGQYLWMSMCRQSASERPGSTMSFLFYAPPKRMKLSPGTQRMLNLALQQLTDDEIAADLGVGRDYVRKLWKQVFAEAELIGLFRQTAHANLSDPQTTRGKERRRLVLDYLRLNLQEIRPGLP